MLSAKLIKEIAKKAGADKCGIAPIARMKNAPDEMNPTFLFPTCKSIVGFVFRIPRGVQRDVLNAAITISLSYSPKHKSHAFTAAILSGGL